MTNATTRQAVLTHARGVLHDAGISDAAREATLLLASATARPWMEIELDRQAVIETGEVARFRSMVERRATRVPLQHLIRTTGFHGIELEVGAEALVPRPDTERLVDAVVEWLRASGCEAPRRVLDVGTGSGAIGLAIAAALSSVTVVAIDSSRNALALASRNARRLGLTDRVFFLRADWLTAVDPRARFDVLVSNPPYVCTGEIDALEPEVRDHDPRQALDGGPDGLDGYRTICGALQCWSAPPPFVAFEVGVGRASEVAALLERAGYARSRTFLDLSGIERVVAASNGSAR